VRRWLASQWLSRALPWRVVVVLIGLGLLALLAVLILKWAPEWLATGGLPNRTARAEEVGRTRTAVLAALAGLIAVTGAVFTGLSYRLNRAG
jgi:tetrahydromethanopterin S-methyltransferase subunit D